LKAIEVELVDKFEDEESDGEEENFFWGGQNGGVAGMGVHGLNIHFVI